MVKQKLLRLHGDVMFYGLDAQVLEISRLVEKIIKYTRDLTAEISPPVLYELGLLPAIEWLTEKFGPQNRIGISLSLPQEIPDMNIDIQETLFRSLRELLNNVAKHASATRVEVTMALCDNTWRLTVSDDGCGFDPALIGTRSKQGDGFGLFNLKVLMRGLGGTLEISPGPVRGTRVTLVVPASTPDPERASHHG